MSKKVASAVVEALVEEFKAGLKEGSSKGYTIKGVGTFYAFPPEEASKKTTKKGATFNLAFKEGSSKASEAKDE